MKTGQWIGDIKTLWLDDGRSMLLLSDVTYVDRHGQKWTALAGETIDGASIPRFFWRFIGSPLTGRYRRASVIHDVYCQRRTRDSTDVHDVFHEIMIHDGVSLPKALAMWTAVNCFGPRFDAGPYSQT